MLTSPIGYVYRLEYGDHKQQQRWTPVWPEVVLHSYIVGDGATLRSNKKILEEANKKTPYEPKTDRLRRVDWNRPPHSIFQLWSLYPNGRKISPLLNSLEMRTGPVI